MTPYDFELGRLERDLVGLKRVGLEFPQGLKPYALEIASHLRSKTDADIFILADPSYGGCDISEAAGELELDALVHFGHTPFDSG